jgi:hypothetical protein
MCVHSNYTERLCVVIRSCVQLTLSLHHKSTALSCPSETLEFMAETDTVQKSDVDAVLRVCIRRVIVQIPTSRNPCTKVNTSAASFSFRHSDPRLTVGSRI